MEKRLAKLLPHLPDGVARWLDLGCGNGAYTVKLQGMKSPRIVLGADINSEDLKSLLELAGNKGVRGVSVLAARAEALPFPTGSFDVVSLIEVLEHVDSESMTLAECHRVLKAGGHLAVSVPNKLYPFETHGACIGSVFISNRIPFVSWLPDPIHRRIARARIYTLNRIQRALGTARFRILSINYTFPPLDGLRLPPSLKRAYRSLVGVLENTWLSKLGVSILIVAQAE